MSEQKDSIESMAESIARAFGEIRDGVVAIRSEVVGLRSEVAELRGTVTQAQLTMDETKREMAEWLSGPGNGVTRRS